MEVEHITLFVRASVHQPSRSSRCSCLCWGGVTTKAVSVFCPNELIKETFAELGLIYYPSEAQCKGLGIFYALMSFKDTSDVTRSRLEEKLVEAGALTSGIVIEKVKPRVSRNLQNRLDQALDKGNDLAHQFGYERV